MTNIQRAIVIKQYLQSQLHHWLIDDVISICLDYHSCFQHLDEIRVPPLADGNRIDALYYYKNRIYLKTHDNTAFKIEWFRQNSPPYLSLKKSVIFSRSIITQIDYTKPGEFSLGYVNPNVYVVPSVGAWMPCIRQDFKELFRFPCRRDSLHKVWVTNENIYWSYHREGEFTEENFLLSAWNFETNLFYNIIDNQDPFVVFGETIIDMLLLSDNGEFVLLASEKHIGVYNTVKKILMDCMDISPDKDVRLLKLSSTSFLVFTNHILSVYDITGYD